MIVHKDRWDISISEICKATDKNSKIKIYPVAFSAGINNFNKELSKKNYIQFPVLSSSIQKCNHLNFELAHEFSRLLFDRKRSSEIENINIQASVKIFISHARKDGATYAKKFNDYIGTGTSLDRFIDVYDIGKGDDFEKSIKQNIEGSALLVIYTDTYSSREWCQKEVLLAKQCNCPIILLDAIQDGELRRFPYMANVKTFHMKKDLNDDNCREIIYNLLLETLKVRYNKKYLNFLVDIYGLDSESTKIFPYPPELYTLVTELDDKITSVIYPEPPLNINEVELIKRYNSSIKLSTPSTIPYSCIDVKSNLLVNKKIGLSVSELSIEDEYAQTNKHLLIAYIEICRYLLCHNANLIYGGIPNRFENKNFVEVLHSLVSNYCSFDSDDEDRIQIYYLYRYEISEDKLVSFSNFFSLHKYEPEQKADEKEDLKAFRKFLNIDENCDARIVLGGKISGYAGDNPGIIEEAFYALNNNKPIYVLGGYGGAALLLARCLRGEKVTGLASDMVDFFNKTGFSGLNNGLTYEENERLSFSYDITENISLVLKGLLKNS